MTNTPSSATDQKNSVAIVTGSATGLGAAVARQLADQGHQVVINYTKSKAEAEATLQICLDAGVEAIAVQANVADDADCQRLAATTMEKWGRIDILVNNAGITKFADHDDLDALTADDFQRLYAVNVIGVYQMVRACAPHMKAAGNGSVVNVSSIAGVTGIGSSVAYTASKGALNTLTLSLARALSPEIRVNAVCPGFIGTRWFSDTLGDEILEQLKQQQEKTTPLGRAGTPEDIAGSIVFFASNASRHITGETLLCDAGMHLGFASLSMR
ncbi:MAG: glucose 1-dehydrogenase [Parvularculales bacterium]